MSVSKFLEISAIDRQDLVVTARQHHGWIEIKIRSAVDVPVTLFSPEETLLLVIVPEKREPMTEAEMRDQMWRNLRAMEARRYNTE